MYAPCLLIHPSREPNPAKSFPNATRLVHSVSSSPRRRSPSLLARPRKLGKIAARLNPAGFQSFFIRPTQQGHRRRTPGENQHNVRLYFHRAALHSTMTPDSSNALSSTSQLCARAELFQGFFFFLVCVITPGDSATLPNRKEKHDLTYTTWSSGHSLPPRAGTPRRTAGRRSGTLAASIIGSPPPRLRRVTAAVGRTCGAV